MTNAEVNCISYVAHRMGFVNNEHFIPPPSLNEVMAVHDKVADLQSAEVVGVVRAGGNDYHNGPTVCHMAMVEPDGTLSHRKEFGAEITREPFSEGLEYYLKHSELFEIMYLARKARGE